MHGVMYSEFRRLISSLKIGGRVLEIGATPDPTTLLAIDLLDSEERIGVNINPPSFYKGFPILQANGNDLSIFPDRHFDCVLSNATLEHDRCFWKTCSEIRRILRVNGIAAIATPAFSEEANTVRLGMQVPADLPVSREWKDTTLVYRYHGAPRDYYRFSIDTFREVIFDGFRDVTIKMGMVPPRIIGCGFRV
jgi:hypothetical protein